MAKKVVRRPVRRRVARVPDPVPAPTTLPPPNPAPNGPFFSPPPGSPAPSATQTSPPLPPPATSGTGTRPVSVRSGGYRWLWPALVVVAIAVMVLYVLFFGNCWLVNNRFDSLKGQRVETPASQPTTAPAVSVPVDKGVLNLARVTPVGVRVKIMSTDGLTEIVKERISPAVPPTEALKPVAPKPAESPEAKNGGGFVLPAEIVASGVLHNAIRVRTVCGRDAYCAAGSAVVLLKELPGGNYEAVCFPKGGKPKPGELTNRQEDFFWLCPQQFEYGVGPVVNEPPAAASRSLP